jgi:hypothetical protein
VFGSEQEMYEFGTESAEGVPIDLPLDWSTSQRARREWTQGPVPRAEWLELGRQLWDAIPPEVQGQLLEVDPGHVRRLKISSPSPAIDDLPWEWLNDGGPGPPFALRPEIRLARSVPLRLQVPPMTVETPVRVLLMLTNPKDERLLDGWAEIEAVRPGLEQEPYRLEPLGEPTWEALVHMLHDYQPHIVHYIGHAGIARGHGNLILHDDYGGSHWISAAELAQALPVTVRLLCLSTCFTAPNYQILGLPRFAQAGVQHQLPTMVTNRYPIRDESVRAFWQAFYTSLAENHGNVNDAIHAAGQTVAEMPGIEADWGSFSLVIRDQTGQAFWLQEAGTESATRREEEIKAQLASRLASQMAQQVRGFGPDTPDIVVKQLEEEVDWARDLTEGLRREEP